MYTCKSCQKEMYSITEFVERWGEIYCKLCDPDASSQRSSLNQTTKIRDANTRNPHVDSINDLQCPICSTQCRVEVAPFSQYVNLFRCPKGDFLAVQCPDCHEGTMELRSYLDYTVSTQCNKCGHASTGIPSSWWKNNIRII